MNETFLYYGENSPEALKELAKMGFYPGRKHLVKKWVCIEVSKDILHKDINFVRTTLHPHDSNKVLLFFSHPKLKIVKEGDDVPIIGEIVRKK